MTPRRLLPALLLCTLLASCSSPATVCEHAAVPAVSIRVVLPGSPSGGAQELGGLAAGSLEVDVSPVATEATVGAPDSGWSIWTWIMLGVIACGLVWVLWPVRSSGLPPRTHLEPPRPWPRATGSEAGEATEV